MYVHDVSFDIITDIYVYPPAGLFLRYNGIHPLKTTGTTRLFPVAAGKLRRKGQA
jgi:hypothetical protein